MTLRGLLFVTACLAPWVAPAAAACKLGLATTLPLTIAGPKGCSWSIPALAKQS